MLAKLKHAKYHSKMFCGGGISTQLICRSDKIVMPTIIQKYAVSWYHMYLLYPGMDCTEATIGQNWYWPNIRNDIRIQIKVFISCHRNKKQVLKYDHLPAKEAEAIPWDILLVDLIGSYKIRIYKALINPHTKALTTIYLATGWFEIIKYKTNRQIQ